MRKSETTTRVHTTNAVSLLLSKSSHSEDLTLGTLVDDMSRAPIPKARECNIIVLQLTHLQHP